MFSRTFGTLKYLCAQKNTYTKIISFHNQQKLFSGKPPNKPLQSNIEGEKPKKTKKQPIPKITLLAADESISVTTLEEAQHLSKRRDLKLVKIVDLDTKTQRPIYKLMTGSAYHEEELKQREQRKNEKHSSSALKGEKLLMLNSSISKHDLDTNIKKILKWITKKYEVRVVINGNAANMEKTESVYKSLEDTLKEHTRFLQKRTKGGDLKFQIIPPKDTGNIQGNPSSKTL